MTGQTDKKTTEEGAPHSGSVQNSADAGRAGIP
jgi:hypothetical protein